MGNPHYDWIMQHVAVMDATSARAVYRGLDYEMCNLLTLRKRHYELFGTEGVKSFDFAFADDIRERGCMIGVCLDRLAELGAAI